MESSNSSKTRIASFADVSPRREYRPSWLAADGSISPSAAPSISLSPDGMVISLSHDPPELDGYQSPSSKPIEATIGIAAVDPEPDPLPDLHLAQLQEETRALEAARIAAESLNQEFASKLSRLESTRETMLEAAAEQVVQLAMLVAERVIAREVRMSPDIVMGLVREALRALAERQPLRIRLGHGFGPVAETLGQSLTANGTPAEVAIDPDLEEFGCVVSTDIASVDESVTKRLQSLLEAIAVENEP